MLWRNLCDASDSRNTALRRWRDLENLVFRTLLALNFRPFAGHVRTLAGASANPYHNDVLMFKPDMPRSLILAECKHRSLGGLVSKEDVMLFNARALDIYMGYMARGLRREIYRAFVSSVPLERSAFRYCLTYGILALQPWFKDKSYDSIFAYRPPVQAIVAQLMSLGTSESRDVRNLIRRAERFEHIVFRKIAPRRSSEMQQGGGLERAYLDLIYMSNALVGEDRIF